ncbi:MAG: hypothetical protein EBE86_012895 [Hormoscilla sp. GUM202]|nr:hypothetical protein [Hormoscilla sp. GUM202]
MNREKLAQIQTYALAMAALLYEEAQATVPEELKTLSGIEGTIRRQWVAAFFRDNAGLVTT